MSDTPGLQARSEAVVAVDRLWDELKACRAVVDAQREALRRISEWDVTDTGWQDLARAALDAEGVSEPGDAPQHPGRETGPGSLTSPVDTAAVAPKPDPFVRFVASPVDTAPLGKGAKRAVTEYGQTLETLADAGSSVTFAPRIWPTLGTGVDPSDVHRGRFIPRGYVEHGPDGPTGVYHAETPDVYLQHGDRP